MKQMSSWLSKGKFNKKDEYYTPPILVKPIIKYLKPNSTIWCPFDTEDSEFFLDKELELLIVDKKVSFDGNTSSFNNSYFCKGILPKQIVFEHLEHNNTKEKFVGSKMKSLGEEV